MIVGHNSTYVCTRTCARNRRSNQSETVTSDNSKWLFVVMTGEQGSHSMSTTKFVTNFPWWYWELLPGRVIYYKYVFTWFLRSLFYFLDSSSSLLSPFYHPCSDSTETVVLFSVEYVGMSAFMAERYGHTLGGVKNGCILMHCAMRVSI